MEGGRCRGSRAQALSERGSRKLGDHGDVLVTAAAQIDQDEIVGGSPALHDPRDRVSAFECREYAFESRQRGEGVQRLPIGHGVIEYAARVFQVSMFGPDTRVIE